MIWEKQSGNKQIAQGVNGKFVITKVGRFYLAKYYGQTQFTFPWNKSIKSLKKMCKDNWHWEE